MTAVQADNTYKLSLLSLSQLLELPTPEGFVLENPKEELKFEPLTAPDDIYIQAIAYKPGIKAAEYRLQGSLKNIRIAQSEFYPQLSFSAGLGSSYYTLNGEAESGFARQLKNNLSKSYFFQPEQFRSSTVLALVIGYALPAYNSQTLLCNWTTPRKFFIKKSSKPGIMQ